MIPERRSEVGSLPQEFESLSVSKRLVRSMSQNLRKKSYKSEGSEDDTGKGNSSICLAMYAKGSCKVGVDTGDNFGCRKSHRSNQSEDRKKFKHLCGSRFSGVDCFSYSRKDRLCKRNNNNRRDLDLDIITQRQTGINTSLPDDILEMCFMRLPLTSLMNARLVCKKWNYITSTPRFMQMRKEGSYQTPLLFLFGAVKDGYCSGEIHAFDVALNKWNRLNAEFLRGRFLFSVASIWDEILIVGGCTSLSSYGKLDRGAFKTHKSVMIFSPYNKTWRKAAPMKYSRSSPVIGVTEVNADFSFSHPQLNLQDRRLPRSRFSGVSEVYEDPHRISVRRHLSNGVDINDSSAMMPSKKQCRSSIRQKTDSKRYVLISVGGRGSWDEHLDTGEIYDSATNKWHEIQKLSSDFGVISSGVFCRSIFFVYSENNKLAGYDIERGYWFVIQTSPPPPRICEYCPKMVSSNGRLFMVSVSWCEGDGEIGRRNKAIRKLWELDLVYLTWTEISTHPDAPMDWNAVFVADKGLIFGVEMFKIFGQVLDFFTVYDVSRKGIRWKHVSRNRVAHELDASSCMTKTMAVLHL
ncbi:uncharacterized protein [Phyllobates terribilis]|uniref:uncharacterized protein n=1 Tax=Phyllobates terribilis TaxID=111132 RepID=UPI003CCAA690